MGKSPEELRAEIEATRAELAGTVDELQDRVTPSRIAQRQVSRARSQLGRAKEAVMGSLPVGGGSGGGTTSGSGGPGLVDRAGGVAGSAVQGVGQAPETLRRQATGNPLAAGLVAFGLGMLVASVIPTSDSERQAASRLAEPVQRARAELVQAGQEVREELQESARDSLEELKEHSRDALQEVRAEGAEAAQDVRGRAGEAATQTRHPQAPR